MKFRIIFDGQRYIVEVMYPGSRSWTQEQFFETQQEAIQYSFARNEWRPLICNELQSA